MSPALDCGTSAIIPSGSSLFDGPNKVFCVSVSSIGLGGGGPLARIARSRSCCASSMVSPRERASTCWSSASSSETGPGVGRVVVSRGRFAGGVDRLGSGGGDILWRGEELSEELCERDRVLYSRCCAGRQLHIHAQGDDVLVGHPGAYPLPA